MYKVSYTNKGTIPSGLPYSNLNPCYTITKEFEDGDYDKEFQEIKEYVDRKVLEDFVKLQDCFKSKEWDGRVTVIDGVSFCHVTSAITPDTPPIPYIEEHALLGTYGDELMKEFYFPSDKDIIIPSVPNIKTQPHEFEEQIDAWIHKFSGLFKPVDKDVKIKNETHRFVGEADFIAEHDGKLCVCDFKKTEKLTKQMKEKYFIQMAAYGKNMDYPVEAMVILSPYNKPVISDEIDNHYEKFLMLRGQFKERFGF